MRESYPKPLKDTYFFDTIKCVIARPDPPNAPNVILNKSLSRLFARACRDEVGTIRERPDSAKGQSREFNGLPPSRRHAQKQARKIIRRRKASPRCGNALLSTPFEGLAACRPFFRGYFLTPRDTPLCLIFSNGVTEWWPLFSSGTVKSRRFELILPRRVEGHGFASSPDETRNLED